MSTILWAFPLLVAVSTPSSDADRHALDEDNLLRNPGFEKGGRSIADWQTIYPPSLAPPAPEFIADDSDPHGGERAGSIVVDFEGGYSSFTQSVRVPSGAKSLRVRGWARIDEPDRGGAATIMVWFTVPGSAQGGSTAQSARLTHETEWTELAIDAAIPEGATEMLVRCGVFGPCSASFDDVVATTSDVESVACKLAVAHGDYRVRASGRSRDPWIRVSIPFPLGGQTPLAVRVTTRPPDAVAKLRVTEDRENRPLEVHLKPMNAGDEVELRVETLTLLRDRPISDGKGIAVGKRTKPPRDVKLHLADAPGIDAGHREVKKIAKSLPDDDLYALMSSLQEFLTENLEYAGGEDQGAEHCLESGKAVCTGYANTAAAILIARDVPTRVLACTTLGSRLQEHYIVESWTRELGWCRMESTAARFPWKDSENLVLRIVYPDAERSVVNVPLYKEAARNIVCSFRMGTDDCWQGSELLTTFGASPESVTELEETARATFERWLDDASDGSRTLLVDELDELPEDLVSVADTAQSWLMASGRLDG